MQGLSDNARDIGFVIGVLSGIKNNVEMLPSQKQAITEAITTAERIYERNKIEMTKQIG